MVSITNTVWQDMHTDVCGILQDRPNLVAGVNLSYSFILSLSDEFFVWEFLLDGTRVKHVIPKEDLFKLLQHDHLEEYIFY